jgi:predicted transcriptional regulator
VTVEQRLTKVEQDVQQLQQADVPAGLRAQAYGLSLVHTEVAEVNARVAEIAESVGALTSDVAEVKAGLADVATKLDRLLERPS